MELQMVDPDTLDYAEAYGISKERQLELSRQLDDMVHSFGQDPSLARTAQITQRIAAFCAGPEEFSYCLILHMGWHQRRVLQLTPRGISPVTANRGKATLVLALSDVVITRIQEGHAVHMNARDLGLDELPITVMKTGSDDEYLKNTLTPFGTVYEVK